MKESRRERVAIVPTVLHGTQSSYIGCSGWSVPKETAGCSGLQGSHLERYSQVLNACEINSSFYRSHREGTWRRWAASVPAGFLFSVKAPRAITHDAKLKCGKELLASFLSEISCLGKKLGPLLFQLPPSLQFDRPSTRKFLSLLRASYLGDVVWEPRHPGWFGPEVDDLLQEFRIARVAADPACVPGAACPGGFAGLVYFRLHGSPRRYYSSYTDDFLNALALRLASLAPSARAWCVFDNTASGAAIGNALELKRKLADVKLAA
jgi:uncharacterized protein YecE (DUF72 family)